MLFSIYIDGISKLHDPNNGAYAILYADDILLILTSCKQGLQRWGTMWHQQDIVGIKYGSIR